MIAQTARKILNFLTRHKEKISPLLILTHDYPDPDTLASAFALQDIASRGFGIVSKMVYGGVIGRMENRAMVRILKIPVHKVKESDFKKYQHAALLDTQPDFRNNSFPKNRRATIVIDQHPSEVKPNADLAVIDPECGATSVILAEALLLLKIDISERVATALAYGILADTLNLYRARCPEIIPIYLKILPHADMKALARIQNPSRSRKFFITLGRSVHGAFVRRRLIVSHLGPVENPDLVSQVADFLLTYKNMQWALTTGRFHGKLHVSLRAANPSVQAGEILRDIFSNRGEAGGHDTIAGGRMTIRPAENETVWQEAEQGLVERLMRRLRIPIKGEFYFPFR